MAIELVVGLDLQETKWKNNENYIRDMRKGEISQLVKYSCNSSSKVYKQKPKFQRKNSFKMCDIDFVRASKTGVRVWQFFNVSYQ